MSNEVKLKYLNPHWINVTSEERRGVGISFDCPCGKCEHRLHLWFINPMDGGIKHKCPAWIRVGNTFEDLTLDPSIRRQGHCTWHGFLKNGVLKEC